MYDAIVIGARCAGSPTAMLLAQKGYRVLLVDAAVRSGVELREAFSVQELIMDGDRVTGIRGRSASGTPVTEYAHMIIGADGMRSLVARTVQAPAYHSIPSLNCGYYSYWSGIDTEGVEFYPRERCTLLAFPTNDHLVCIGIEWEHQQFPIIRADIEGNFTKTLDLAPDFADRVRRGSREERFVGTADLPNFFRKPYGPGWALVGDAGYHKDPILGHGITDAFRDAELLAEAVHAGLSEQRPLEAALAEYERRRNETALPIYEFNTQFARQEPPSPEMQQLFTAMRGNQAATDRYFATIEGTISPAEFFSPENIRQIMFEQVEK